MILFNTSALAVTSLTTTFSGYLEVQVDNVLDLQDQPFQLDLPTGWLH
jgi:hypothetical protein